LKHISCIDFPSIIPAFKTCFSAIAVFSKGI
jgi:hypothetical protein